jgi:putative aldouronate transport system permease protein
VIVKGKRIGVYESAIMIALLLISLTMLYPFVYLLFVSIAPIAQVIKGGVFFFPTGLDWSAYQYVFTGIGIDRAYLVTMTVTVCGTILSLTLSSFGAYVLSIRNLPGRNFLLVFLVITMVFSGGLIPVYLVVKALGMIDRIPALFIPNAINTFWLIVMRNFFRSIPESLSEAAHIDGYSEYQILFRLILPVSTAIIATLALFYGVALWNQYFNCVIYINDAHKQTLQVLVRSMYLSGMTFAESQGDNPPPPVDTIRAATIMVSTLPILCAYPFLQRYFVKGIMVGAVKG